MPRSGSTWSYNVVKLLLENAASGSVQGGYDEQLDRFLSAAPPAEHIVVKCHGLDRLGRVLARSGVARVVYTRRDVPDAIVSCMRMFSISFDDAVAAIASSLEVEAFHDETGNVVKVDFEQLQDEPTTAIRTIASYLGVDAREDLVEAIAGSTHESRMRQVAADFAASSTTDVAYDPETLLHVAHFPNRPAPSLSAVEAERLRELSNPLVQRALVDQIRAEAATRD